jgi:hypothetical protein
MSVNTSRDIVLKKLSECFPNPAAASKALAILDTYGTESWHREVNRVHLALLKVSGGNLEDLRLHVRAAQSDYRDTLVAAEFAQEWQAPPEASPTELAAIRKRDRDEYEAWLRRAGG